MSTNVPLTSFTTWPNIFRDIFFFFYRKGFQFFWHLTFDRWHVTHDTWHMTHALWRLRQNGCHSVNSKTEWCMILVPVCWLLTEWFTVWMPFCCFQIIKEQETERHQYHVPFCLSQLYHSFKRNNILLSLAKTQRLPSPIVICQWKYGASMVCISIGAKLIIISFPLWKQNDINIMYPSIFPHSAIRLAGGTGGEAGVRELRS